MLSRPKLRVVNIAEPGIAHWKSHETRKRVRCSLGREGKPRTRAPQALNETQREEEPPYRSSMDCRSCPRSRSINIVLFLDGRGFLPYSPTLRVVI